jgi:hypothetical protein
MLRQLTLITAAICALGLIPLGACGGDDDDDDDSSSTGHCCINGWYYECPSADAVNDCPDSCTRDASKDDDC